jgi:hypothetical protein
MGLKVAIVGLSPTTHGLAPWDDAEWEVWGLPWDVGYHWRMDRLFEMHDIRLLESEHAPRKCGYLQQLRESEVPLYMQEAYFTGATKYPFEEVEKSIGLPYWNSSIAYAMAMAIHDGAEEIGIFGVDMRADDEYGYQKPNLEYLVGVAVGKGIKVTIPEESPLCKFSGFGVRFGNQYPTYKDRYGWLG